MKKKILVIDDDLELAGITKIWLRKAGYNPLIAEDGVAGLRRMDSYRPDLVLLDINMPQLDGWEVCRRIRDMSNIPVIMVTVNRQKSDILKGFGCGADDYVTKPFYFPELIARVDAALRRADMIPQQDKPGTFQYRDLELDWRSQQVYVRGERVRLSPTEFKLLSCLINNRGGVVTHEELLREAWGTNYIGDRSFVKIYIRYLRYKIEKDPRKPELILTEWGVGYRFSMLVDSDSRGY